MRVFVNYRRKDVRFLAPMLYAELAKRFGASSIYMDTEAIPVGVDFAEHIRNGIDRADVVLALVGDAWGPELLSNEQDFVRQELLAARAAEKVIIPVLVYGHAMVDAEDLPEDLQWFRRLNAHEIGVPPRHADDIEKLLSDLSQIAQERGLRSGPASGADFVELKALRGHASSVISLDVGSSSTIASCGADATVRIWHPDGKRGPVLRGHQDKVHCVKWRRSDDTLASSSSDGTVRVWRTDQPTPVVTLRGHDGEVRGCAWSPDGNRLASSGKDGTVRIWDPTGATAEQLAFSDSPPLSAVAFRPDRNQLALANEDGVVLILNALSGGVLGVLDAGARVTTLSWAPLGGMLAVGTDEHVVGLWDVATRTLRSELRSHTGPVNDVAFSPDGRQLASAGTDRTICVWDIDRNALINSLVGHADRVRGLAWVPSGDRLASCSDDRTVRLWGIDADQGEQQTL